MSTVIVVLFIVGMVAFFGGIAIFCTAQEKAGLLGIVLACTGAACAIGGASIKSEYDRRIPYRFILKEETPDQVRIVLEFDEKVGSARVHMALEESLPEFWQNGRQEARGYHHLMWSGNHAIYTIRKK